jgi:hypothetical protein
VPCRYSYHILTKLEFSGQIFEKYLNVKFQENSSSGSGVVPGGQADRRDEASSLFYHFFESAIKEVTAEGMTGACNSLTEFAAHPVFFILHTFALYLYVKRLY